MAHSPHRRRKGCGLCKPWKVRGLGRATREGGRDPARVNRALGRNRRGRRHDIPADQR